MSWLFGIGKDQTIPEVPPQLFPPAGGGDGDDKGGKSGDSGQGQASKMDAYRFDSAALERAAKAAKELEKSGNGLYVVTLSPLVSRFRDFYFTA